MMDVDRSDPLSTSSRGTVESVLSGEFVILLVPKDLESIVKEILDELQGNVFGRAALGWHMSRIGG